MGLLNPEAQAPAPSGQAPNPFKNPAQAAPEEGEQATPEEQESYDKVVSLGSEVLHGDEMNGEIMQMLEAGKDNPGDVLADIAMLVLSQLDEKSGYKIPEEILIPAADDILSQAGELAAAAGIFPWDEQVKGAAAQSLWAKAGEKYQFDPQEIQELIAGMDQGEVENIRSQQEQIAMSGTPQQAAPPMGAV